MPSLLIIGLALVALLLVVCVAKGLVEKLRWAAFCRRIKEVRVLSVYTKEEAIRGGSYKVIVAQHPKANLFWCHMPTVTPENLERLIRANNGEDRFVYVDNMLLARLSDERLKSCHPVGRLTLEPLLGRTMIHVDFSGKSQQLIYA